MLYAVVIFFLLIITDTFIKQIQQEKYADKTSVNNI